MNLTKAQLISMLAVVGLVDPACTLEQACTVGYAQTVRPASSYTTKLKRLQMKQAGLGGDLASFEEDHVIPLSLCGHPRDPRNLLPERWDRARAKDVLEVRFHRAVCRGQMSLKDAQRKIVGLE